MYIRLLGLLLEDIVPQLIKFEWKTRESDVLLMTLKAVIEV